jgi:NAD(P)H-flavin reductase
MVAKLSPSAAPAPTGPVPQPYAPTPYVVRSQHVDSYDTTTLVLTPTAGGSIPAFLPGQFNMLYVYGVGEAAISISGDPTHREELVHTIRTAGKTTQALTQMRPGSVVGVRGPYGVGWPVKAAVGHDVLVVAGGLGLPPLRPALYEIMAHRADYGRVEIIFGARTPKDLLFYSELQHWRMRDDMRVQVTVDAAGRDWYGDVGVVTTRLPDARFDPAKTVAFVCGPEIMMRLTAQAVEARGVAPSNIYISMERNMKCAIGQCGHCQLGPSFMCRDGPVFGWQALRPYMTIKEL